MLFPTQSLFSTARGRGHNFGVMIIQLQATQTASEEDRYKQRSAIYHISLRGLVGIATTALSPSLCVLA